MKAMMSITTALSANNSADVVHALLLGSLLREQQAVGIAEPMDVVARESAAL